MFVRGALVVLAVVAMALASTQTACSKKARVAVEDQGPVRVVVLPFSATVEKGLSPKDAQTSQDLQWAAMAAPALLIRASRQYPDLEVVPLAEVMPTAISAAGAVRSFDDETASSLANWVSAKWAIVGEIRQIKKNSYSIVVDFIPAKSTDVPFRYIKTRRLENVGMIFQSGLRQWLRYTTGRQIPVLRAKQPGLDKLRPLGEALDREYGWLVAAEPGNAKEFVEATAAEDDDWAKLLFSPTMYPSLAKK
jgi:hypothetical protein